MRKGCVAAFGLVDEDAGTERLVVVAETRVNDEAERSRIAHDITENVAAKVGMPPDVVQLAPPHAVPKTSSGKIRRNETRDLYAGGRIANRQSDAPWRQMLRLWFRNLTAWINHHDERAFLALRKGGRVTGRWLVAAPFGLAARLTPSQKVARKAIVPGLRMLLALDDVEHHAADEPESRPSVLFANRNDGFDAALLLASLATPTVLADESSLRELTGPMAFLAEPLVARPAARSGDLKSRIEAALAAGFNVAVFADSPLGESPSRSRFRLEGLSAAAETGSAAVPVWRNGNGFHIGDPIAAEGSPYAGREQIREALAKLAADPGSKSALS